MTPKGSDCVANMAVSSFAPNYWNPQLGVGCKKTQRKYKRPEKWVRSTREN